MTTKIDISVLKKEIDNELHHGILGFWTKYGPSPKGGFVGQIAVDNTVNDKADRGAVLNARILWAYSAAYNFSKKTEYLQLAERAYQYIVDYFYDKTYGGVYWMLDSDGQPVSTKKQIYAIAFTIYALAEYVDACKDQKALDLAISLFNDIEKHSFDPAKNGYFEAFSEDWQALGDLRLSLKDANEAKTMNTHLHVLEAYARLLRIWPNESLKKQLENLVEIHLDKITDQNSWHYNLFFDEDWNLKSDEVSFGHDIEGAWLVLDAAEATGNIALIEKSKDFAVKIAHVCLKEGMAEDGSMFYERNGKGELETQRHWWVQAEAMVGYANAYQLSGEPIFLEAVQRLWDFIKTYLACENGEWVWGVHLDYTLNTESDKAGPWKCPYHNSRACIEILKRL